MGRRFEPDTAYRTHEARISRPRAGRGSGPSGGLDHVPRIVAVRSETQDLTYARAQASDLPDPWSGRVSGRWRAAGFTALPRNLHGSAYKTIDQGGSHRRASC